MENFYHHRLYIFGFSLTLELPAQTIKIKSEIKQKTIGRAKNYNRT